MFKRADPTPQRTPFGLTGAQLIEDIEAICYDEVQRNKLYLCMDERPPQEHKFDRIEDFLKGTYDLEKNAQTLSKLLDDIQALKSAITASTSDLKRTIHQVLNEKT